VEPCLVRSRPHGSERETTLNLLASVALNDTKNYHRTVSHAIVEVDEGVFSPDLFAEFFPRDHIPRP